MNDRPVGEKDLRALLCTMSPHVTEAVYTFATLPDRHVPADLRPLGVFEESEGTTVICALADAQQLALRHEGAFRQITLTVHSSLQAVGFIAAIADALRAAAIPCNVVSAFHHDHLFIPVEQIDAALRVLHRLTEATAPPAAPDVTPSSPRPA